MKTDTGVKAEMKKVARGSAEMKKVARGNA
jgi:hypothetical protein